MVKPVPLFGSTDGPQDDSQEPDGPQPDDSQDTAIDPNRYKVPASDSRGHNTPVAFRCMPAVQAKQNRLVRPGNPFGFETAADFLRYAQYSTANRLDALWEAQGGEESSYDQLEAYRKLYARKHKLTELNDFANNVREQVNEFRRIGLVSAARETVSELRDLVAREQDEETRTFFEHRLRDLFAEYL